MTKDKNPKPNPSSYPNNIPFKNKDKILDLPSFAYVTNGITKPTVDTSLINAIIRALVLDDQDLINVEDPYIVLLLKLKDVNLMSNIKCATCKVFRHGLDECPKNIDSGKAKNVKKPSQAPRGVSVCPKVGFKPTKQTYRVVPKQTNTNISGGKKKDVELPKEVSNSNPFDAFNSAENDDDLVTLVDEEGKHVKKVDYSSDHDNEDEVASTDNDMANFMALEKDLPDKIQDICNNLDIKVRGLARSQRISANGSQFNHNITTKDKNPKPNPSSYPNNIHLKNKDKFPDLPSFASVTNGIAKPTVDTSSTNDIIRALVLDDQDLINVEDPFMVLLVKLKDVNLMINMYVICRNEDRGLPLCAWGSSAYKKLADMFGKFMFFEAEESMKMSSARICISTKLHNFVSERVLVEVHGVNYDMHVHELGTWNINIVDETLDSSDNLNINGMEKVEDFIDKNSLAVLNDLNDLKETINELASNEIQHPISKENMDQEDDINKVSPEIAVSTDLSRPPGFEHMKRTSSVHYKIIAKILANKLAKVIDKIVSHKQSTFIDGRQILDGPLILTCLSSSRASLLVNGSPTSEFSIKRGLGQGDPLSPFLFILVMEGLHNALSTMVFYLASGLKINIKKSNVYGIGVSDVDVSSMASNSKCVLLDRYNRLYRLEREKDCLIIDRIDHGQWSWNWSRPILGARNSADLLDILFEISYAEINEVEDTCVWSLGTDRTFSVKDARCIIDSNILPSLALSTARFCPFCIGNVESSNHIFFKCNIVKDIWMLARKWCDISFPLLLRMSIGKVDFLRGSVTFRSHPMRKCDIFDNIRMSSYSWLHHRGHMICNWIDWLKSLMLLPSNSLG
ncbi:hypothetical protein Tco_0324158 [Tanacetum coccineum]